MMILDKIEMKTVPGFEATTVELTWEDNSKFDSLIVETFPKINLDSELIIINPAEKSHLLEGFTSATDYIISIKGYLIEENQYSEKTEIKGRYTIFRSNFFVDLIFLIFCYENCVGVKTFTVQLNTCKVGTAKLFLPNIFISF